MSDSDLQVNDAIVIGRFGKTFGVRGEIRVHSEAMHPERWLSLERIYAVRPGETTPSPFDIQQMAIEGYNVKLKLRGVDTLDDAKALTNVDVLVPADERAELDNDEFYVDDIIGFDVKCQDENVGKLADVLQQGHHDLWVVKNGIDEFLIPAIREFVTSVNLDEKLITVKTTEGLRSTA